MTAAKIKAPHLSWEMYRLIVETAEEGIWIGDPTGKTIFVNQKMADMLGYTREEMVSSGRLEFKEVGRQPSLVKSGQEIEYSTSIQHEYKFHRKDGGIIWMVVNASPLFNRKGKYVGNLLMLTDITKRKQLEGVLVEAKDELETKVEERTSQLEKKELELLESRNQLRGFSSYLREQIENERKRLAAEIHDELGQMLTGLKIDLSWLSKKLPKGTEPLFQKTASILAMVDEIDKLVKRIAADLRPSLLDDLGLQAAMTWLVRQFQSRNGIPCKLLISPESFVLDKERSVDVFRVAQEALTNISRHAKSTEVGVSLNVREGMLVLKIRDNGRGVTGEELADPGSFGLIGMRERARRWDGTLDVKGIPGKGTTINMSLPLNKKKE